MTGLEIIFSGHRREKSMFLVYQIQILPKRLFILSMLGLCLLEYFESFFFILLKTKFSKYYSDRSPWIRNKVIYTGQLGHRIRAPSVK